MKQQLFDAINERKGADLAAQYISNRGVDLSQDFFSLSSKDVDKVLDAAKEYKYRKSKNAPGSTARMFWQFAQRAMK